MTEKNSSEETPAGKLLDIDADMTAYLEQEARRRNISIEEAYRIELAAEADLAKITPRNADLLDIANRLPAPQAWYDE